MAGNTTNKNSTASASSGGDELKNNASGTTGGGTTVEPGSTTATPGPKAAASPSTEDTVAVPKDLLKSILDKQTKIEKKLEEKDKIIEQLQYAADKGRMGIWEQRNVPAELIRTYGVGIWKTQDKETGEIKEYIIRGTKMISDEVIIEDNGGVRRLVENQTIRLFLDDGLDENGKEKELKEVDVSYVNFYRSVTRKRFPLVKQSSTDTGEFRTLRFDDGREVEFDIKFLNF